MPLYAYSCDCGAEFEHFFRIGEDSQQCQCLKCDRLAVKILTPPRLNVDYPGYTCPVSGKWIEGRKAHRENLKRTGCRVLEPGERAANERARRLADERDEAVIGEAVEAAIETMPTRQVEQLAAELSSGAEAVIERSTV